MSRTYLVVPTNRPESLRRFLTEWQGKGGWQGLVVVEDAPRRSDEVSEALTDYFLDEPNNVCKGEHYSHVEIRAILGDDAWIISRGDSACRCFGFLAAWWAGADAVLTLDDDCYPHYREGDSNPAAGKSLVEHHLLCTRHRRWECSPPGNIRTRGLPNRELGEHQGHVNLGLWSGSLDIDAATELAWAEKGLANVNLWVPGGSRIVPHGQYVPVSGMNLFVRRDALPLFYFPLMGAGQPYSRFDDIWAGVIAKHVMDHLGWHLSVGEPFVRHERASDPHANLVREAPGLEANEVFWRVIDRVWFLSTMRDPLACMARVGRTLQEVTESFVGESVTLKAEFVDYLDNLGHAIRVWARLFAERPEGLN